MSEVRIVDRRNFADTSWPESNPKYNSAIYDYMNLVDDFLCVINKWTEKAAKNEECVNLNSSIDSAFKRAKDMMNFKVSVLK